MTPTNRIQGLSEDAVINIIRSLENTLSEIKGIKKKGIIVCVSEIDNEYAGRAKYYIPKKDGGISEYEILVTIKKYNPKYINKQGGGP
ncbi:hypothetical protein HZC32_01265 [Candidatus Woesearchaeota archaeon]|nr:hypothetical protein [Candidatus Woesearchaeota archaeon]